ncbi:hypothetical protein DMH04_00040 [Kibdelosporangium aridum]|uniref:Uncharacterized protein n=2 Tax=Kibdelosporangium aridum TaxID=2030 RepID=A0A428ZTN7_KIBAR|nr:hypothetical protein DMH04_00040 [Kibdelosporangium aridum]
MGMLTAAIQAAYRWHASSKDVFHFDALPTALASTYNTRKARPDLLFDMPGLLLAGEARGRSRPPAATFTQQRKRLDSLLPWSHHHGNHPLAMTWAYATKHGVVIDLYTRAGGLPGVEGPIGRPAPEPGQPEFDVPAEMMVAGLRQHLKIEDVSKQPYQRDRGKDLDRRSPRTLADEVAHRINSIEQQLYATAPQADTDIRVADQPIRGDWVPLDMADEASGSFLLGILEQPLSQERSHSVTARLRERTKYEENRNATVLVSGRLVVAIIDDPNRQPWDLVAD